MYAVTSTPDDSRTRATLRSASSASSGWWCTRVHTPPLGRTLERRRLGLADLVLAALADQLVDRGHRLVVLSRCVRWSDGSPDPRRVPPVPLATVRQGAPRVGQAQHKGQGCLHGQPGQSRSPRTCLPSPLRGPSADSAAAATAAASGRGPRVGGGSGSGAGGGTVAAYASSSTRARRPPCSPPGGPPTRSRDRHHRRRALEQPGQCDRDEVAPSRSATVATGPPGAASSPAEIGAWGRKAITALAVVQYVGRPGVGQVVAVLHRCDVEVRAASEMSSTLTSDRPSAPTLPSRCRSASTPNCSAAGTLGRSGAAAGDPAAPPAACAGSLSPPPQVLRTAVGVPPVEGPTARSRPWCRSSGPRDRGAAPRRGSLADVGP